MQGSNKVADINDLEKQQDILYLKNCIESFENSGFSKDEIKSTLLEMKNYSYLKHEIIGMVGDMIDD